MAIAVRAESEGLEDERGGDAIFTVAQVSEVVSPLLHGSASGVEALGVLESIGRGERKRPRTGNELKLE